MKIIDWLWRLIQKSDFPIVRDLESEQQRLNIVRIITGLIMTQRSYFIYYVSYRYFDFPNAKLYAALGVLLSISLTLGILTPLTILAILIFYNYIDIALTTQTLGTNVLTILLIVLFLANAGARYSLDSLFMSNRFFSYPGKAIAKLYRLFSFPDTRQLTTIFWFGFSAYALLSLAAIYLHLHDSYWTQGYTTAVMLSNSYLSREYAFFRWFETNFPWVIRGMSVLASVGQSIFQVLMIPLLFFRPGRYFVVVWGLIFFSFSYFIFQLSYLPAVEFILWFVIFYRADMTPAWAKALFSKLQFDGFNSQPIAVSETRSGLRFKNTLLQLWLFILCIFSLKEIADHYGGNYNFASTRNNKYIHNLLYWAGMVTPNVFNKTDLTMGDSWRVIYRKPLHGGEKELVPLNGSEGQRLEYLKSDIIYFGNGLRYRRGIIGRNPEEFNQQGNLGYKYTCAIAQFDYKYTEQTDTVVYSTTVYESFASQPDLPVDERYKLDSVYNFDLYINDGQVIEMQ